MKTFNITYDLRTPGKDYTDLINALRLFPKAVRYQQSAWFVQSLLEAPTIRSNLQRLIDSNDLLNVSEANGAAWSAAQETVCGNALRSAFS